MITGGGSSTDDRYDKAKRLCMAASKCRPHLYPYYTAATGRSVEELLATLDDKLESLIGTTATTTTKDQNHLPEVSFFFPGTRLTTSMIEMGVGLYEHNPVFKSYIDECDQALTSRAEGHPTIAEGLQSIGGKGNNNGCVHDALLLFAIEYGLAKVWSILTKPNRVYGVGVGNLVAAVISGTRTLADTVRQLSHFDQSHKVDDGLDLDEDISSLAGNQGHHGDDADRVSNSMGPSVSSSGNDEGYHKPHLRSESPTLSLSSQSSTSGGSIPPISYLYARTTETNTSSVLPLSSLSVNSKRHSGQVVIVMGSNDDVKGLTADLLPSQKETTVSIPSILPFAQADSDAELALVQALAQAYEVGVPLDLDVHATINVSPQDLPLYPFEQTVYMPVATLLQPATPAAVGNGGNSFKRDYGVTTMFEESWLPRNVESRHHHYPSPDYMVWVCSSANSAAALLRHSRDVVVVSADIADTVKALLGTSTGFKKWSSRLVIADFSQAEGSKELCCALRGDSHANNAAVVYVSGESIYSYLEQPHCLTGAAFRDVTHLMGLLRCMVHQSTDANKPRSTRLWVVTWDARVVIGSDKMKGLGMAMWSMTKSALQEYYPTNLWATLIDLEHDYLPSVAADKFVALLESEMVRSSRHGAPDQLAYRAGE